MTRVIPRFCLLLLPLTVACSTAGYETEDGVDEGTGDESSDEGYPGDPSRDFLTKADATAVVKAANATALNSSVGDFSWQMTGIACGNAAGGCDARLVVRPRDQVGKFDPVALAGVVGRVISGNENTPIAYVVTLARVGSRGSLETLCQLNAPYTSRDQLLQEPRLADDFNFHLLECVFAVEREVEGIVK